jgi:protein-L-isoaspartate(D-aspartate) O-methyltransferase
MLVHDFVPPAARAHAFADIDISLPTAHGPAQSMLSPKVEARLLQELEVAKHERVLEIGTGSGFMTALLAQQAQHVLSYEIDAGLAEFAKANLRRAGIGNLTLRAADGSAGAPDDAPFDVIVLSGSVPKVPKRLFDQLKPGGRRVGSSAARAVAPLARRLKGRTATSSPRTSCSCADSGC